jgi:hypothetical protein
MEELEEEDWLLILLEGGLVEPTPPLPPPPQEIKLSKPTMMIQWRSHNILFIALLPCALMTENSSNMAIG